jgi:phosphodiesterase/alkaline phosphatase D-like protein
MGIGAVLLAAAAAGNPFSLGVAAGEIQPTAAQLWAHATPGRVTVEVARSRAFPRLVFPRRAVASKARDGTIHVRISGLRPGRRTTTASDAVAQ